MTKMSAADVRAALTGRWPDDAYLHIAEAPDGPSRQGRKLDVLVVALWASRKYELDGVEVKVSVSDWRREMKSPQKAEWWWAHCNRFWIAAPSDVAAKIKPELPGGWGLLSVSGSGCRATVQPERRDAKPFTWQQVVGLLRATADSGFAALNRAEHRGFDRGYQRAKAQFEGGGADARLRAELEDLRGRVSEFEAASGVNIGDSWRGDRLGETVRTLLHSQHNPARVRERLDHARKQLEGAVAAVTEAVSALVPDDDANAA